MFRPGDIVVTEGRPTTLWGWLLRWVLGSRWTHVFLVESPDTLIEAYFGQGVRRASLPERVAYLRRQRRRMIVLNDPGLTPAQRTVIATTAAQYVGRRYDVVQALLWALTGGFWRDGTRRMICSRLVTACYAECGIHLFTPDSVRSVRDPRHRSNLLRGYATPPDLYYYTRLVRSLLL